MLLVRQLSQIVILLFGEGVVQIIFSSNYIDTTQYKKSIINLNCFCYNSILSHTPTHNSSNETHLFFFVLLVFLFFVNLYCPLFIYVFLTFKTFSFQKYFFFFFNFKITENSSMVVFIYVVECIEKYINLIKMEK